MVYKYIKDNGLHDPNDGRIINADDKLKSLFNLKEEDKLTFRTFQKYMAKLYKEELQEGDDNTSMIEESTASDISDTESIKVEKKKKKKKSKKMKSSINNA